MHDTSWYHMIPVHLQSSTYIYSLPAFALVYPGVDTHSIQGARCASRLPPHVPRQEEALHVPLKDWTEKPLRVVTSQLGIWCFVLSSPKKTANTVNTVNIPGFGWFWDGKDWKSNEHNEPKMQNYLKRSEKKHSNHWTFGDLWTLSFNTWQMMWFPDKFWVLKHSPYSIHIHPVGRPGLLPP